MHSNTSKGSGGQRKVVSGAHGEEKRRGKRKTRKMDGRTSRCWVDKT